jgi:voltage-gated potassium channel
MHDPDGPPTREERRHTLHQLEAWLEKPMLVLGLVWLALLVLELTRGLSPAFELLGTAIWVVFIADFALRLALAPDRSDYLRHNWLTLLSLVVPALRILRVGRAFGVLRAARGLRGVRLVKVVASLNRGMGALGRSMGRRGFGYVLALTALVTLGGAAGMYAFEREVPGTGITDYGTALWWTTMIMTTMGSEYWPRTAEGRALCVMLALYAFAVFGYVTATLATYFVGRDAESSQGEVAGAASLDALRAEIAALRAELRARP